MTKRIKLLILTFLSAVALYAAASATPINYPNGNYKTFNVMEAQSVPTSPTVVIATSAIFGGGWISCTGTQTITLSDANSASWLPVVPWAGPQATSLNLFAGAYVSGSLSITASATGCKYSMWWRN